MERKNYGLILRPQKRHAWIMGSGKATAKLGADAGIINPKGDWWKWLGAPEHQKRGDFDTFNCVCHAILKAIRALAKFKGYKIPDNLSERYAGCVCGTVCGVGNEPWRVAELIATQFGVVAEERMPWSPEIDRCEEYYTPVDENVVAEGQQFLREYEIEPEWVIPPINNFSPKEKNRRIKAALKRGTVVASVLAWQKTGTRYTKPVGARDTHLVMIAADEEISDQYEPFKKKLDPEYDYNAAILFFMRPNPTGVAPFEQNYLVLMLQKALRALKALVPFFTTPREARFDVPMEPLPAPEPVTVPSTVPVPVPEPPRLTNREHLYQVAKGCLGRDMAKTQNELGCAEAVNAVHKLAFGRQIGGGASTALLYKALKAHPDFMAVTEPLPGDIIISPTGTSSKGAPNGHTGIVGKTHIMSNNSLTYKWDATHTPGQWAAYYGKKLGFPTFYFRRKGVRS